jgi:hypothetical protein
MLLDRRRVWNWSRNPYFWDNGKCFVAFCCHHFLQFVYDLTVSLAWLRHQSTQNSMRKTVMPLDWRRFGNSSRNRFFFTEVSVSIFSVVITILHFVCDLTVSLAWLRHQSTQNSMRKTVVPLEGRRVGDSCRDPFFWEWGKCFIFFCCHHFLQFVCDLTVSLACLRHPSTQNLMRKTVVPLERRRVRNSCRDPFFCDRGTCFILFCRRHFLQFVYDLTVSLACLRHQSTRNLMRKTVVLSDGRRVRNLCRNPFFVTMVSVSFCSVIVTFYNLYMTSPFLLHVLGINHRRIRWGRRW